MKKYPTYLSVGNWLFVHIEPDWFANRDNPVGGSIPNNLYIVSASDSGISMNISKDLRTYEGLIEYGCTEPDKNELIRLLGI